MSGNCAVTSSRGCVSNRVYELALTVCFLLCFRLQCNPHHVKVQLVNPRTHASLNACPHSARDHCASTSSLFSTQESGTRASGSRALGKTTVETAERFLSFEVFDHLLATVFESYSDVEYA